MRCCQQLLCSAAGVYIKYIHIHTCVCVCVCVCVGVCVCVCVVAQVQLDPATGIATSHL